MGLTWINWWCRKRRCWRVAWFRLTWLWSWTWSWWFRSSLGTRRLRDSRVRLTWFWIRNPSGSIVVIYYLSRVSSGTGLASTMASSLACRAAFFQNCSIHWQLFEPNLWVLDLEHLQQISRREWLLLLVLKLLWRLLNGLVILVFGGCF